MHKLMTLITIFFLTSCTDHIIDSTTSKITLAFQDKQDLKPKHLKHFIPQGYTIIRTGGKLNKVKTYLNTDDIYDYAVLLSNGTQHNAYADATRVTLAIFEGQKDGTFKLKSQTGNLTYAFIYTSVEKQLTVLNTNVITLKHQSMRHDYQLKFKYQADYDNYMLIGSDYNNYGNAMHIGVGKVTTNFIYGIRKSTIDYIKMTYSNKDLYPISMVNNDNVYDLISD